MSETATAPRTEKQERYRENRENLKAISAGYRLLVKEGAIDSVNEGLRQLYREQGHEVLNTYNQWREEGKQVQKGERALLLWGSPRQNRQDDEDDEFKFWPICYVFSNLQVK